MIIDPHRLRRLEQLFDLALEQPSADREAWLGQACADDQELLATLRDMLADVAGEASGLTAEIGALADQASSPPDRSGEQIGRYRLQSRICWGGMAEVYRAVRDDGEFSQEVALKIGRADRRFEAMGRWFEAERRLLARLRHPNVCQIFDGGSSDAGEPYFVMERIDGKPFLEVCLNPHMRWSGVVALYLELCAAVAHAHRHWVVHRDIKPENVMVAESGRVKLLDFGIAATLEPDARRDDVTQSRWYSPGYAAPEIVDGEVGGTAADIYSLGVLLSQVLDRCPASARVDIQRIAAHASANAAAERYETVDELAADLRRLRDHQPISLRQHEHRYVLWKLLQRRSVPIVASVLVLFVLALAFSREVQLRQAAQSSALQAQAERDSARAVSEFLANAYAAADPEVHNGVDISVHRFLELQAESLARDVSMAPDIRAQLQLTMGQAFGNLGQFEEARALLELALANQLKVGDNQTLRWGEIRVLQARAERQSGNIDDAQAILADLLTAQTTWPQTGEFATLRANMYSILAALEQGRRNLDMAAEYVQRALDLFPLRADREQAAVGQLYHLVTLGSIQAMRADDPSALETFAGGLKAAEALGGEANIPRLALLGWMGIMLDRLGRPLEAEPHLRQAVTIAEQLYPADHPKRSGAYGNLGTMLLRSGRLNDAEPLLRKAMDGFVAAAATQSPMYLRMHKELGELALQREDLATARPLLESYLQSQESAFGGDSPRIIPGLALVATLELLAEQPQRTVDHTQRAMRLMDADTKPDHLDLPVVLLLAAEAHAMLGDTDQADRDQSRAEQLVRMHHADNPRVVGYAWQRRAEVLHLLGRSEQANSACVDALAQLQATTVAQHPVRLRCMLRMAQFDASTGNAEGARARLNEVAPILRATVIAGASSLQLLQRLQTGT